MLKKEIDINESCRNGLSNIFLAKKSPILEKQKS